MVRAKNAHQIWAARRGEPADRRRSRGKDATRTQLGPNLHTDHACSASLPALMPPGSVNCWTYSSVLRGGFRACRAESHTIASRTSRPSTRRLVALDHHLFGHSFDRRPGEYPLGRRVVMDSHVHSVTCACCGPDRRGHDWYGAR